MSDKALLYCPHCNHACKSLRGLAQHISHRPACEPKSSSLLVGVAAPIVSFHQSFVALDEPHADEAMEPLWQDTVDLNAFDVEYQRDEAADIAFEEEHHLHESMHKSAYSHQNRLDKQVSTHLSNNGLVDVRTMLDTEDMQDSMFDIDESLAYHDDDSVVIPTSKECHVNDGDDAMEFTDRLKGQHTAEERMSLQLLKLLRAIGAPNFINGFACLSYSLGGVIG